MIAQAFEALAAGIRQVEREASAQHSCEIRGQVHYTTVAGFAKARAISASTVREAIREGRLPAMRIGRAVRVPADATITPRNGSEEHASARADRVLGLVPGGRR